MNTLFKIDFKSLFLKSRLCYLNIRKPALLFSLFLSAFSSPLQAGVFELTISPDPDINQHMNIRLMGSLGMRSLKVLGLPVIELSGITWDSDENILYAVSDKGLLYHIKLGIKENQLDQIQFVYSTKLKDKQGKPLKGKYSDSEGLALINGNNGIKNDSRLLIAFENKARIAQYSPDGHFLKNLKIPRMLKNKKNYRNKNKSLESVTLHPSYGAITAAEYPLKHHKMNYQTLYSQSGKTWHFAASKAKESAVTGLETLPNGDILILERAWRHPFTPIVINLRQLHLDKCNQKNECQTRKIATLSGADGWLLDNFEGVTHFKNNQYLMVSDNNQNPFQNTILVLFEILEPNNGLE